MADAVVPGMLWCSSGQGKGVGSGDQGVRPALGAVVCGSLSILDDGPLPKVSFFNADFRSVHVFAIGHGFDDPTSGFM